jgi:hypothetical protein
MVDENNSISKKPPEAINERIIKKLVAVKGDIIRRYEDLLKSSNLSHTKQILEELINMERRDIDLLENADSEEGVMYSLHQGKENDLWII